MRINEWVLAARTHKGWTQQRLGDELGKTKGNVSAWERGRHEPGHGQMVKIAELTGFPFLTSDQVPVAHLTPDAVRAELSRNDAKNPHGRLNETPIVAAALELSRLLAQTDEITRESIAPLLLRLAKSPEDSPRIGRLIDALVNEKARGSPQLAPNQMPAEPSSFSRRLPERTRSVKLKRGTHDR